MPTVLDSRAPRSADPVSDADRPLRALWRRYTVYRARLILAFTFSVINKVADVMPELLIGAAVDVVVRGDQSFVPTCWAWSLAMPSSAGWP